MEGVQNIAYPPLFVRGKYFYCASPTHKKNFPRLRPFSAREPWGSFLKRGGLEGRDFFSKEVPPLQGLLPLNNLPQNLAQGAAEGVGIGGAVKISKAHANRATAGGLQGAVRQGGAVEARPHADAAPIQFGAKRVRGNARGGEVPVCCE